MALYTLEPERNALHGRFSRDFLPAVTIDPGDTVRFRTLDAGWGLEPPTAPGVSRRKFEPRMPERDDGHALCGPVAVRGAEPGMTLEVRIDTIVPGAWGWTYAGGAHSQLNRRLGAAEYEHLLLWTLDAETMTAVDQYNHRVAMRPFMGVLGLPPAAQGFFPTMPPRFCGGNIDCKELVAGSTLFLPITVPGALFSLGDGHAAQGDGEVCSQGIECPMERVEVTFFLRDDLTISMPRALTPAGWVTFGFHEDLNEAMLIALDAMLDLMSAQYSVPRTDALALASLAVDLRITQIVNGVCGVHALLPYKAIQ